jgi:hypothetical protein
MVVIKRAARGLQRLAWKKHLVFLKETTLFCPSLFKR